MIYEYAVEPLMLLNEECGEFLASNFGIPRARLVSEFPEHWESLVHIALSEAQPVGKLRIMEALSRLSTRTMPRKNGWNDDDRIWLEKADEEHAVRPFHAILATSNPERLDHILERRELHEGTKLWNVDSQCSVPRIAAEMAACARALLECAREVYFVDPHFGPEESRFRRPFEAFMDVLGSRNNGLPLSGVELHIEEKATSAFIKNECENRFRECVPRGMTVRVVRWKEHKEFHNRYILTDRGGMYFGIGLDEGDGKDDVSLLSDKVHKERREQFQRNTSSFTYVDEFQVVGRK